MRHRMRRFVALAVTLLAAVALIGPARASTPKPKPDLTGPRIAVFVARVVAVADWEARMTWTAASVMPPLPPRPSDGRSTPDLVAAYKSVVALRGDRVNEVRRASNLVQVADRLRMEWAAQNVDGADSPIFGPSMLTAAQLAAYARSVHVRMRISVPIELLAQIFINEGEREGIRGDVAFAQAMLETGTFSGFVGPNNFGALGGCAACSHDGFATAQAGVRAQIQLLRWRTDPTLHSAKDFAAQPSTLPARFLHVGHVSPTWQALGGQWSPDPLYGVHVYALYLRMLHWAATHPIS
jgi:hypothetical protein